jgi:hypothetical protein
MHLEDASKGLRRWVADELWKVDDDYRIGRCRDLGDGCRHEKRGEVVAHLLRVEEL